MKPPSYKRAIAWIIDNDDTEWLKDEEPTCSVTATFLADMFGLDDQRVTRDLKAALDRRAAQKKGNATSSNPRAKAERNALIFQQRSSGMSFAKIGSFHNLSEGRVYQLYRKEERIAEGAKMNALFVFDQADLLARDYKLEIYGPDYSGAVWGSIIHPRVFAYRRKLLGHAGEEAADAWLAWRDNRAK
jgi:hypothetical protein